MAKDKQHSLYLINPDSGRVELIHADDVENKQAAGYKQPLGQKANGEDWNSPDDLLAQDIAAQLAKDSAERQSKKDAEAQKDIDRVFEAAEKARQAQEDKPDMKVQVVTPKKAKK